MLIRDFSVQNSSDASKLLFFLIILALILYQAFISLRSLTLLNPKFILITPYASSFQGANAAIKNIDIFSILSDFSFSSPISLRTLKSSLGYYGIDFPQKNRSANFVPNKSFAAMFCQWMVFPSSTPLCGFLFFC